MGWPVPVERRAVLDLHLTPGFTLTGEITEIT
jgi:hypothetical protein